ncbi:MAG: hypothetical protein GYA55_08405 [SAR324 cluster bacterium]|uniref:Uncharacterized protein n=1 Tax=SAR324 cluster bacterium TaxID=2024889 RepID=A0A7X9IKG6_9DELT|nr:hypothetical protein [SAR324 cluster bacterium]
MGTKKILNINSEAIADENLAEFGLPGEVLEGHNILLYEEIRQCDWPNEEDLEGQFLS